MSPKPPRCGSSSGGSSPRRVPSWPSSPPTAFTASSPTGTGRPWSWEADHRRHAEAGNAIRDLKYGVGLNHLPPGRFAANGAWLAIQVMAHNLARWTARIALGEQVATTKTLRRRFFSSGRTDHPLGPPPHPASATELAVAGEVRPRPSPAPSHSTPSLTAPVCHRPAQRTTEVPANSRHHGPRAVPSVSSVLILPPGPSQTVIGAPKSACRPPGDLPLTPNTSPDNRACNSLTPFRCPHAVPPV